MAEEGGVDPHPFQDSLFSRQVSGPPLIHPPKPLSNFFNFSGAQGQIRTDTGFLPRDFKSLAATVTPLGHWSEMKDLNLRSLAPKASALPSSANSGYYLVTPTGFEPVNVTLKG